MTGWLALVPDPTTTDLVQQSGSVANVVVLWLAIVAGAVVFGALAGLALHDRHRRG